MFFPDILFLASTSSSLTLARNHIHGTDTYTLTFVGTKTLVVGKSTPPTLLMATPTKPSHIQ